MTAKIVTDYRDAEGYLEKLRTSRELLQEVAAAMVAASNECTENDPSGARGWRSWQMGTRRARELHCGNDGWVKDDTDQIPSILNEVIGIKIVVCNTDDGTCIARREPQNRSRKGPATERLVETNQTELFTGAHVPHPDSVGARGESIVIKPKFAPLTYILCVYQEGDDHRVELSRAVESSGGYFAKFDERIFIIGGESRPDDPVKRKSRDSDSTEFDIPVVRKKS